MKFKNILMYFFVLASIELSAGFSEEGEFVSYKKRLSVRVVENQTIHSSFKMFYANSDSLGLLSPQSIFLFKSGERFLQQDEMFCLQCVKGSFLPIFIEDEGPVSGQPPEGFHGPYYLSMWLNYPDVSDDQKEYVRYVVEIGKSGEIGIRINAKGDCQILALSHIKLLP